MANSAVQITIRKNALPGLLARVEAGIASVMADWSVRVVTAAQANAPVKTGFLRDSIHVVDDEGALIVIVAVDAPYAFWVHFGTRRMAPRPFLQAAIDAQTSWLEPALLRALVDAVHA